MRVKIVLKYLSILATTFAVFGCINNSRNYEDVSRGTGWRIDDEYKTDYEGQKIAPGLVFIPGGSFTMGRVQDDVMHDWNNSPTQQHVQSFYMDETEVTNLMYLEYLDYLKKVYPPEQEKYSAIYLGALPDTLVWANRLGYNEPLTNNYLRHPAYRNYPVVGVSWIQATEYSQWRTDRVNQRILMEAGYIASNAELKAEDGQTFDTGTYLNAPTLTFGGDEELISGGEKSQKIKASNESNDPEKDEDEPLFSRRKDGLVMPNYRLPTEAEWEYAALALVSNREYNSYRGRKKYPWDGQYVRAKKGSNSGDILANFKLGDGDYGGIAGWSVDGAAITNEIMSYPANAFGLYDMAGNVAEWVADVYRPVIDDNYNDFNDYRGNVYMKNAINEDGTVSVMTLDEMQYDTLSDGSVVARVLPGELKQVPTKQKGGFLAGKKGSLVDEASAGFAYQLAAVDSTGVIGGSQMSQMTSLDNNEIRVFKGGSWKDIAYWLDPATRRFLPQYMATNYIGFRCAMSRVGGAIDERNKPRN